MNLTADDRKALQGAISVLTEILNQSPEVPDVVHEWPEGDEHLRGEFWEDQDRDCYRFSEGWWEMWSPRDRKWSGALRRLDNGWAPFARTTDPSLPRTWDTLDTVDADVERVTGDYVGMRRELARSPLSESGWFQRIQDNAPRRWVELSASETYKVTNIKETS